MTYELETGIAERLYNSQLEDGQLYTTPHTLQVLSVTPVAAMLATQLNTMVTDQSFTKHTVIVTKEISCNIVDGKRLLILMSVHILGQADGRIGEPENLLAKEKCENCEGRSTSASAVSIPDGGKETPSSMLPQQHYTQRQEANDSLGIRTNMLSIENLTPYSNNWTIKGLVTKKEHTRPYYNTRGEGKIFGFTLADKSGEIQVTTFNQKAEELYQRIQEGKVYYVKGGRIAAAKFKSVQNEFELTLERDSEVEECTDTTDIPVSKYKFIPLGDLANLTPGAICDVIAVVKEIGVVKDLTSKKNGRQYKKRELTLVDKCGLPTQFTLWGGQAETFQLESENAIIAIKSARVGDYRGRDLGSIDSTVVVQNPDLPEALALRGWYDGLGSRWSFQAHKNVSGSETRSGGQDINRNTLITIEEIRELTVPEDESNGSVYFFNRATVTTFKPGDIVYPACSTQLCSKKVVEHRGSWRCEKCGKSYDSPQWRFLFTMDVADHTGQEHYQGFNEVGEKIFGRTGNEVVALKASPGAIT
ncbi:Replication factor A protein 1 [Marasmius crinis-equi]|uniref:Replication protein A subunit n=1 Tax=Marasmius crinis-equi TaxID=585013 RepID=A0ABR3FRE6_9AGAR